MLQLRRVSIITTQKLSFRALASIPHRSCDHIMREMELVGLRGALLHVGTTAVSLSLFLIFTGPQIFCEATCSICNKKANTGITGAALWLTTVPSLLKQFHHRHFHYPQLELFPWHADIDVAVWRHLHLWWCCGAVWEPRTAHSNSRNHSWGRTDLCDLHNPPELCTWTGMPQAAKVCSLPGVIVVFLLEWSHKAKCYNHFWIDNLQDQWI